jgi:hypothetical protein
MTARLLTLVVSASLLCPVLAAQVQPALLSPDLMRLEGTDPDNHVAYVRIFLSGTSASHESAPPTLTAQCTRQSLGKLAFELCRASGL